MTGPIFGRALSRKRLSNLPTQWLISFPSRPCFGHGFFFYWVLTIVFFIGYHYIELPFHHWRYFYLEKIWSQYTLQRRKSVIFYYNREAGRQ